MNVITHTFFFLKTKFFPKYSFLTISSLANNSGFPLFNIFPSNIKYVLSVIARVSWTLWSVIRTPMFLVLRWAIIFWISSTAIGSTPAKGSSSNKNLGSVANALAISYPCFPLDLLDMYLTGSVGSTVGPAVTKAFSFFFLTM